MVTRRQPLKQNKKKTTRVGNKKKKNGSAGQKLKGGAATAIVIVLASVGVWQCIDGDLVSERAGMEKRSVENVDVGAGKSADPTIVNEELLEPDKMGKELDDAEVVADEVEEDDLTIAQAGEELGVDTDAELLAKYPLHAVAYHFHTQVRQEPRMDATVVSYARRGATFKVSERVSKKDCKRGWHELLGGGFICDGLGFKVSKDPVTWDNSPPDPDYNDTLPYGYKYIKRNDVVQYWKLPSAEEQKAALEVVDRISRKKSSDESAATAPPAADESKYDQEALSAVLKNAEQIAGKEPDESGGDTEAAVAVQTSSETDTAAGDAPGPEVAAAIDTDTTPEVDPFELPRYVHMRMEKGFYVSVTGDEIEHEDSTWAKTVRGRYIESSELYPAKPSGFEGALLGRDDSLPMGFIIGSSVKTLSRKNEDGPFSVSRSVARYDSFKVLGTVVKGKASYIQIGENEYVNDRRIAVAYPATPPDDLAENERWIDIDLSEQTLVAYEGTVPVFATIISTGRAGFETPEGEFHIYNKHVSITMDDPDAGAEAYSIEDVPWTQYFEDGYALHTAFWHDGFGRVRSHGCVNLSPADARRLFYWTGPHLNEGVHGIIATRENPGTRIVVHQ